MKQEPGFKMFASSSHWSLFYQDLEKVLDVFNITLARQQAQMEVNLTYIEEPVS